MGALLQKILGGGPLLQLGNVECCNDEVRSSSSSDSWRTHASGHVETARERESARGHDAQNACCRDRIDEVTHAGLTFPRDPKVAPDTADEGHAVPHLPSTNRAREM